MPLSDLQLWRRIAAYPFPEDSAGRSFEAQLRAEHDITSETARAAIEEYRRFAYLAASGQGRTVPSVGIDAVWHLHMGHSRDYLDRFGAVLGKVLHHRPGTPDHHQEDFLRTLARYEDEFDAPPPMRFWGNVTGRDSVLPVLTWLLVFALGVAIGAAGAVPIGLAVTLVGLFMAARAVPGALRKVGLGKPRPLRDRVVHKNRRNAAGACGGGCASSGPEASCGGGCGGD